VKNITSDVKDGQVFTLLLS